MDSLEEPFNAHPKTSNEDFSEIENLKAKSKCHAFGLLLMFGSGGYYFGYYMGIWNPIGQKHLRLNLNVAEDDINTCYGLINVCYAVGAMFGCLFGSMLATKIGRIRLLLLTDIFSVIIMVFYMFPN